MSCFVLTIVFLIFHEREMVLQVVGLVHKLACFVLTLGIVIFSEREMIVRVGVVGPRPQNLMFHFNYCF